METYLSINECINQNIIALSERQIKRRVKEILNNSDDNRVIYCLRKGIKTIVLMVEYATTIFRNRKPKRKKTTTNEAEQTYINHLLKTEITIKFNEEFNEEGINNIVRFYNSKFPAVYVIEGESRYDKHVHIAVCEDIEDAKRLILKSLVINDIDIKKSDIKISQIASTSKILDYFQKGNYYGAYLRFKNCNYTLPSIEYLQRCQDYNKLYPNKTSILSPYGKNHFTYEVLNKLCQ